MREEEEDRESRWGKMRAEGLAGKAVGGRNSCKPQKGNEECLDQECCFAPNRLKVRTGQLVDCQNCCPLLNRGVADASRSIARCQEQVSGRAKS